MLCIKKIVGLLWISTLVDFQILTSFVFIYSLLKVKSQAMHNFVSGLKVTSNVDKKSASAGELRIIGNASKDKDISDELVELLIFIAPRVID